MYCIQFLATLHLFLHLLQMSNNLNTSFFLYYAFITVVTGDFYTKGTHWCPFLPEHYNSFFLFVFGALFSACARHRRCTCQQQPCPTAHQKYGASVQYFTRRQGSIPATRHQICCCFRNICLHVDLCSCLIQYFLLQKSFHFHLRSNSSFYNEFFTN